MLQRASSGSVALFQRTGYGASAVLQRTSSEAVALFKRTCYRTSSVFYRAVFAEWLNSSIL